MAYEARNKDSPSTCPGSARVPLCELMHGGPVKLTDLPIKDDKGRQTGLITPTLRLASS